MTTPESKSQQRRRETRASLLESAFNVFAQRGYKAASVDEITRGTGKSKGAFYYHFASKESVFIELLTTYVFPVQGESPPGRKAGDRRATLVALLMEFWVQAIRNERVREGLLVLYESRLNALVSQFDLGTADIDAITEVCRALIALEDGLLVQEVIGFPETSEDRAAFVRRLLAAYLVATDTDALTDAAPRGARGRRGRSQNP